MARLVAANGNRETYTGTVEGAFLLLDRPLQAGPRLYIGEGMTQGDRVELDGVVVGALLSGISNVTQAEPVYQDGEFINFAGQALLALGMGVPAPGLAQTVLVIDSAQGKAFVAGVGGRTPPGVSPFRGYRETLAIREATVADRASFDPEAAMVLGERSDGIAVETWWLQGETIYGTLTIAGEMDVMEVISTSRQAQGAASAS